MTQDVVIYLSEEDMKNLWWELNLLPDQWDGKSDIRLESVPHVVFRKAGTIE